MVDPHSILERITGPHRASQTIVVVLMCLVLIASGAGLVSGAGETIVWNVDDDNDGSYRSADLSEDGSKFFTAETASPLKQWDVSDGSEVFVEVFSDHQAPHSVAYNDEANYVAYTNWVFGTSNDNETYGVQADQSGTVEEDWSVSNNAVGIAERNGTTEFYILTDTHIERREASTGNSIDSTALFDKGKDRNDVHHAEEQGRVYVTTNEGLTAYSETLTFQWNLSLDDAGAVGTVGGATYVADGSNLVKVSQSGSEQWRRTFDSSIQDIDGVDSRGTVFLSAGDTISEVNDEGAIGYEYNPDASGLGTLTTVDVDDTGDTLTYYVTSGENAARIDTSQDSQAVSSSLSGVVYDQDNNEVNNSRVVALNESGDEVANVTTNKFGQYEMFLSNGTYNVTASKDGYFDDEKVVEISGDAVKQDFELVNKSEALHIKTRRFIEHGQSVPYEVTAEITEPDGDVNRSDVTTEATVTSGNTTVFTVNAFDQELVGTSDTSINQRTYVQAEWTDPDTGETYTTQQNVTVANETVDNLDILPAMNKLTASIGGGTDANPRDKTFLVIIIGTALAAAVSIIATSLAGLGALTSIMMMAWILGVTNDGIAMVTVFTAMFIGMNVAGNVDYTVRRG